jgi:replicative DNA helicase
LSDPFKSFPGKEDMEISLQKMSDDLKKTQQEKDKAVQELTRLKQHLLEKVLFIYLLNLSVEAKINDEPTLIFKSKKSSNYLCRSTGFIL